MQAAEDPERARRVLPDDEAESCADEFDRGYDAGAIRGDDQTPRRPATAAAGTDSADRSSGLPRVGLSTSSVFPESTHTAFRMAADLRYDGVELMVGTDAASCDLDKVREFQDEYQVAVLSVHAPCLMLTPRVWGTDPEGKLRQAVTAATLLGADLVVVHPPFAWQRTYAAGFAHLVRELCEHSGIIVAVENMYPWRGPGVAAQAYVPDWDPTDQPYDHLTLDLSHAATAGARSLSYLDDWGPRLRHLHLTDGHGSVLDEHLMPGEGNQRAWQVVELLVSRGYQGHIIHEVSTRRRAGYEARSQVLAECLARTREQIAAAAPVAGYGERQ